MTLFSNEKSERDGRRVDGQEEGPIAPLNAHPPSSSEESVPEARTFWPWFFRDFLVEFGVNFSREFSSSRVSREVKDPLFSRYEVRKVSNQIASGISIVCEILFQEKRRVHQ